VKVPGRYLAAPPLAGLAVFQAHRWGMPLLAAAATGAAMTLPLLFAGRAPRTAAFVAVLASGVFSVLGYGQGRLSRGLRQRTGERAVAPRSYGAVGTAG
jgi:hypothetical protein